MRFKLIFAFAFALLLSVSAMTAHAQTAQVSGKVTLRQADGTEVPVQDALVTFHRTDISGKYEVKTNRKGEYVRLGMPYGTFLIVVSAPNARPTFLPDVNVGRKPDNNFVLAPGDGRVLTLAEAKAAAATPQAAPAGGEAVAGGAPAAAPANNAEARRLAAEEAKKIAEIEAKNARATDLNTKLPEILKAGNAAFSSKNYAEAITAYDQGIAADPEQGVFHLNKSIAYRERGVNNYRTAAKAKDQAGIKTAREDLKASADAAEKAVAAYRDGAKTAQSAPAASGGQKSNELSGALSSRAETYRLALAMGTQGVGDAASKAILEYIAVETDSTKKNKLQGDLITALIQSSNDSEAVMVFQQMITTDPGNMMALYGLGLKLSSDTQKAAEASRTLRDFAAKAKGQEFADKRVEAVAIADELDAFIKSEKEKTSAPAKGNTRRRGQ